MAEIIIRISDRTQRIAGMTLAGAVLACAIFYLWSSGVFAAKYQLRGYVADASGLSVRAPVILGGVKVGSVSAINPASESSSPERRIEIDLRINKRYQDAIRSDSTASLVTPILSGGRYISIQRGINGSVIKPDGEIRFARELTLKDFGNSFEKAMACLKLLTPSTENKPPVPTETPSKPRVDQTH